MKKIFFLFISVLMAGSMFAQTTITVAQAIEIGKALAHDATTQDSYTIEGYVNVITDNSFNTSYNNMTFWMADTRGSVRSTDGGAIQVYRGRPDVELQDGDKVRVVAKLHNWNGKVETSPYNSPVTWLESKPEGKPESPVTVPDVGEARIKVFAQNLRNYYFHPNTGRGNYTEAEIAEKTNKIIDAMMWADADIFALCEVEAQEVVLQQLADSMNTRVEEAVYVAIADGINEAWDAAYNNNIKSGFIYRKDKVKPYNKNYAATTAAYYRNTMRIQAFEELSTGERFTLSMNHFKAKDSSEDQGNNTREINARQLLTGLSKYAYDADILAVGDFNCTVGESPITIITNAGYEELLLKYDFTAFSHCYSGGELIDHAFANTTMSNQITGAGVYHISTSCGPDSYKNYDYRYSDHDPYLVGINLAVKEKPQDECQDIDTTFLTTQLSPLTTSDATVWKWDNTNKYAKGVKSGGVEAYLFTPELDMSKMSSVAISFAHTHKYASSLTDELRLWVTKDFKGTFEESTWTQLTINPYASNKDWTFVNVNIDVPVEYVGQKTVFAFDYKSTATAYGTWEIKNLKIKASCENEGTGVENIQSTDTRSIKVIENGHLYLIYDGRKYDVRGLQVR